MITATSSKCPFNHISINMIFYILTLTFILATISKLSLDYKSPKYYIIGRKKFHQSSMWGILTKTHAYMHILKRDSLSDKPAVQ